MFFFPWHFFNRNFVHYGLGLCFYVCYLGSHCVKNLKISNFTHMHNAIHYPFTIITHYQSSFLISCSKRTGNPMIRAVVILFGFAHNNCGTESHLVQFNRLYFTLMPDHPSTEEGNTKECIYWTWTLFWKGSWTVVVNEGSRDLQAYLPLFFHHESHLSQMNKSLR